MQTRMWRDVNSHYLVIQYLYGRNGPSDKLGQYRRNLANTDAIWPIQMQTGRYESANNDDVICLFPTDSNMADVF